MSRQVRGRGSPGLRRASPQPAISSNLQSHTASAFAQELGDGGHPTAGPQRLSPARGHWSGNTKRHRAGLWASRPWGPGAQRARPRWLAATHPHPQAPHVPGCTLSFLPAAPAHPPAASSRPDFCTKVSPSKGRQQAARTQTKKREGAAGNPEGGRKLQQGQARGPGGCCWAVVSQGSPRLPPNCWAEAKGAMPAPREASYQAASTAHQGCQPPPASCPWLMLAPGCALDVSPLPRSSLKGAVCPQTAQILSPRHQRKCGCQGTPPAMQPCLQDKAPRPGGGAARQQDARGHGARGAPGHGSGWGPTSRAPGPALRLW